MTLVLTGVAPIIRATIATLKTKMPAQVAAFNAEGNVQIDVPATYVLGAADPRSEAIFPLVEVSAAAGSYDVVNIGGGLDHDVELTVLLWQEGARGELSETYEASLGLGRCALEILLQDNAFGSTVGRLAHIDGARSPWTARALPADLAADTRKFTKWHVPYEIRFLLPATDGLH